MMLLLIPEEKPLIMLGNVFAGRRPGRSSLWKTLQSALPACGKAISNTRRTFFSRITLLTDHHYIFWPGAQFTRLSHAASSASLSRNQTCSPRLDSRTRSRKATLRSTAAEQSPRITTRIR